MPLAYRINEAKVIHEIIDGDAIMINLDTGNYYSMNEAGVFVWALLQQGASVEAMAAQLGKHYGLDDDTGKKGVDVFILQLQKEELVSERAPETAVQVPQTPAGEYQPPHLMVFSDMQELLLLDPIHEISEEGWPHIQKK